MWQLINQRFISERGIKSSLLFQFNQISIFFDLFQFHEIIYLLNVMKAELITNLKLAFVWSLWWNKMLFDFLSFRDFPLMLHESELDVPHDLSLVNSSKLSLSVLDWWPFLSKVATTKVCSSAVLFKARLTDYDE